MNNFKKNQDKHTNHIQTEYQNETVHTTER
jgi:hypothetical protein